MPLYPTQMATMPNKANGSSRVVIDVQSISPTTYLARLGGPLPPQFIGRDSTEATATAKGWRRRPTCRWSLPNETTFQRCLVDVGWLLTSLNLPSQPFPKECPQTPVSIILVTSPGENHPAFPLDQIYPSSQERLSSLLGESVGQPLLSAYCIAHLIYQREQSALYGQEILWPITANGEHQFQIWLEQEQHQKPFDHLRWDTAAPS